ncbi:MAG: hypothetical protein ACRD4Q_13760, partial [Candidatus Acidiferrales bacterium]
TDTAYLPRVLDHTKFNLAVAPFKVSPEAQTYFDNLDLVKVASQASDRRESSASKVRIFRLSSLKDGESAEILRRNLPDGAFRENFISTVINAASKQQACLGEIESFDGIVNLPGSRGMLHHDNLTLWRSLWQPSQSEAPADTTIVADDAIHSNRRHVVIEGRREEINNYGTPDETNPQLLYVAPPSALLFWTGELLSPPRIHAEPNIPEGGRPRFTLIAQRHS